MTQPCCCYVATSQKVTVPQCCVAGFFVSTSTRSLVISFGARIEVWVAPPDGLQRVCQLPLRGRVSDMRLFKPAAGGADLLFLLFESTQTCVLRWDDAAGSVVPVSTAQPAGPQRAARQPLRLETGDLALVSPDGKLAPMFLYQGLISVAPISDSGAVGEMVNLRFEEFDVVDMCFVSAETGCGMPCSAAPDLPTLAVLLEEKSDEMCKKHVRFHKYDGGCGSFVECSVQQQNVDPTARILIPVDDPIGGVLLVGAMQISYMNPSGTTKLKETTTILVKNFSSSKAGEEGDDEDAEPSFMLAWCSVSPTKFLLGDFGGKLFSLSLVAGDTSVDLRLEALGYINIPNCLAWIGSGDQVFVGGGYGDSSVVRILAEPSQETGTLLEVVDVFPSMGSIMDFCVVDPDKQGQGTMVSCSGGYRDGSLRVVRNGIGISDIAVLPDVGAVRGIWSLRQRLAVSTEEMIVISFINDTKALGIHGEELAEAKLPGIDTGSSTIFCGNVVDKERGVDYWLQVTPSSVHLVSAATKQRLHSWSPGDFKITLASAAGAQLLVAGGSTLIYFEVAGEELREITRKSLEYQLSCVHVPAADALYGTFSPIARHCCVGLWTEVSTRVLELPGLETLYSDTSEDGSLPRSLVMQGFAGKPHLVVGKADGTATVTEFEGMVATGGEAVKAVNKKKLSLGTQPLSLRPFTITQTPPDAAASAPKVRRSAIFVSSDKPSVLHEVGGRVVMCNVNLKAVQHMCPFNDPAVGEDNCLAFITEGSLLIGSVDGIQTLHMRTVPLGEQPRRVAFHSRTQHYFALTSSSGAPQAAGAAGDTAMTPEGADKEHHVRLFRKHTFEEIASLQLETCETGVSIAPVTFADDPNTYVAIGTAFVNETEESWCGRILILDVADDKIVVVAEKEVKGTVYCLHAFGPPSNGRLLAGIGSSVQMFCWHQATSDGAKDLALECSHHGHILSLALRSFGDFIVLGDLMRSVTVLQYKPVDGSLEEIAHDFNQWFLTAIEVINDELFVVAEDSGNLVVLRHCPETADVVQDKFRRLETVGGYGLGEQVNCFQRGSLVAPPPAASEPAPTSAVAYCDPSAPVAFVPGTGVLFGTTTGAVGTINQVPQALFDLLLMVQGALVDLQVHPTGVLYSEWRSFHSGQKNMPSRGFIDGDLIEGFGDLPLAVRQEVVKAVNLSLDAVDTSAPQFTVESLSRVIDELGRLH